MLWNQYYTLLYHIWNSLINHCAVQSPPTTWLGGRLGTEIKGRYIVTVPCQLTNQETVPRNLRTQCSNSFKEKKYTCAKSVVKCHSLFDSPRSLNVTNCQQTIYIVLTNDDVLSCSKFFFLSLLKYQVNIDCYVFLTRLYVGPG